MYMYMYMYMHMHMYIYNTYIKIDIERHIHMHIYIYTYRYTYCTDLHIDTILYIRICTRQFKGCDFFASEALPKGLVSAMSRAKGKPRHTEGKHRAPRHPKMRSKFVMITFHSVCRFNEVPSCHRSCLLPRAPQAHSCWGKCC